MEATLDQIYENVSHLRQELRELKRVDIKELRDGQQITNEHLVSLNGTVGTNKRDIDRAFTEIGHQREKLVGLCAMDRVRETENRQLMDIISELKDLTSGNRDSLLRLSLELAKIGAIVGVLAKLAGVI